jgi:hypothetical protein
MDVEKLQTDLVILGDWAVENEMKINPNESKFHEGTSEGSAKLYP